MQSPSLSKKVTVIAGDSILKHFIFISYPISYPSSCDKSPYSKLFKRGLVMAALNINSLIAHIEEVRVLTHETNIDILAINETKL